MSIRYIIAADGSGYIGAFYNSTDVAASGRGKNGRSVEDEKDSGQH